MLGTLVNVMMDLKIILFLIHGMAQDWIAVSIVIDCMKHVACVQPMINWNPCALTGSDPGATPLRIESTLTPRIMHDIYVVSEPCLLCSYVPIYYSHRNRKETTDCSTPELTVF